MTEINFYCDKGETSATVKTQIDPTGEETVRTYRIGPCQGCSYWDTDEAATDSLAATFVQLLQNQAVDLRNISTFALFYCRLDVKRPK